MADTHDWRVVYQRAGWTRPHQKVYRRKDSAVRLLDRMFEGREGLAPLVVLRLERRPKGTPRGGWQVFRDFAIS